MPAAPVVSALAAATPEVTAPGEMFEVQRVPVRGIPVLTYVNAPKAVTPRRVIDLTTPGAWSEEQERLEREALAAAAPSADEVFDQQLAEEAATKRDRAVNS